MLTISDERTTMNKELKNPITLKTGVRKTSVDPVKIEAAVHLVANGITNQVLTKIRPNVFRLSNGSRLIVKRLGKGRKKYTTSTFILITQNGQQRVLGAVAATKNDPSVSSTSGMKSKAQ